MQNKNTTIRDVLMAASREISLAREMAEEELGVSHALFKSIDGKLANAWMLLRELIDPYGIDDKWVESDLTLWQTPDSDDSQ